MSDISNKLGLEKNSFTPVAKLLLEKGYIDRTKDENDRRAYILTLTDKGNKRAKGFMDRHIGFMEGQLSQLTDEEKELYFSAINLVVKLTKRLDA